MRLAAVIFLCGLLAACSTDAPGADPAGGGGSPTSEAQGDDPASVPCGADISDDTGNAPPDETYTVVAGAVALPSTEHPALQTVPVDSSGQPTQADAPPTDEWFAKRGLVVSGGHRVELTVAPQAADMLRIGWGSPSDPGPSTIVECSAPAGQWLAFAGGYWVQEPGCYGIDVRVDDHPAQRVDIGIGAPCPGQPPPAGP